MHKIVSCFYAEYGRYITKFRALPLYIDGLKLVERRTLLALYDVARNKFVKSGKVVGHLLGSYHPHGDLAAYGTLQQLVRRGFVEGEGNWGSQGLDDDNAAASRYTECKLSKWVEDLAFKYIHFVPWENIEYENEPLYLPCPIPLGLIGEGLTSGIAFHKTLIPRYELKDLAKRLLYILNNQNENIIILPKIKGCIVKVIDNGFEKILTNGEGSFKTIPSGDIQGKHIKILGRSPETSFNKLKKFCDNTKEFNIEIIDLSKKDINLLVKNYGKISAKDLLKHIWDEYLIHSHHINNLFVNEKGLVQTYGIDEILSICYEHWRSAVFYKRLQDCERLIVSKIQLEIITIIRKIIEKYDCHKIDDIINAYHADYPPGATIETEEYSDKWTKKFRLVSAEDIIETCKSRTIKQLIENKIDLNESITDIQKSKKRIDDLDIDCYQEIINLSIR